MRRNFRGSLCGASLAWAVLLLSACQLTPTTDQTLPTTCDPATAPGGCPKCLGVMQHCTTGDASACETDTSQDNQNCGGCGIVCNAAMGATCNSGVCRSASCDVGFGECNADVSDGCETDLNNNPNHCGACATQCPGATHGAPGCSAGKCTIVCQAGYLDCNGDPKDGCEVNGAADINHCGTCGTVCQPSGNANAACAAGTCIVSSCTAPFMTCKPGPSTACETNIASDPNNCGTCSKVCGAVANGTPTCKTNNCDISSCTAGFGNCDGMLANGCEADFSSNVNNCGQCGKACTAANATPGCTASACTIKSCNTGFGNCDGMLANGCESDLTTSVGNCGLCGKTCTVANATPDCKTSACTIKTCNAGFANCDNNVATGCEVNTNTDNNNCGACAKVCGTGTSCVAGACKLTTCPAGFDDCNADAADGCEVNLGTDSNNCGACGTACGAGKSCVSKACVGSGLFELGLSWSRAGDMDLVVTTPGGKTIYYNNRGPDAGTEFGQMDKDDTVGTGPENIFWAAGQTPPSGMYYVCAETKSFGTAPSAGSPVSVNLLVRKPATADQNVTKMYTAATALDSYAAGCNSTLSSYVTTISYP